MQAASITYMQMASNSVEPSSEAASSSQALRVNAGLPSQTTNTLFTSILQKGIEGNVPLNTALGLDADSPLISGTDGVKNTSEDEAVDVCSLLMQLMVMNASVQADGGNNGGSAESDGEAVHGILGVINENPGTTTDTVLKGLDNAVSVILQNDGKAAEVLRALAASKSATAGSDGQPSGTDAAQLDAALAGITEALNNELQQSAAATSHAQAAMVEASTDAAMTGAAAVGVIKNDNAPNAAFLLGKNDKSAAASHSNESKTAGNTEGIFRAGASAAADGTAEKAAAGVSRAADKDESGFAGFTSRDRNESNDVGMAANGANSVVSGAGGSDEMTAEKTSAVERALNRFTDDLRSFRGGSQEVRIVLEPESLGVLVISVIKTESGISAKIKSEDKEIAAIISGQIQKLISSMESKGLTVDNVDVAYSQMEQNTSFAQQNFSQSRDEASKGYTRPNNQNTDADTPNVDFWQSFQGGTKSGDTEMDYRI